MPIDVISQTSAVPSFASISMRAMSKGLPFIPIREAMSPRGPASERLAHSPLLRTSRRLRTAEAGSAVAGLIRRAGSSLTTGVVAVGSNRITAT